MTDYADRGLRYIDASDLDDRVLDLDDLDVINARGDDLGEIDGLLVDAGSGRPRYLVIDSGGWFHSKRFAVPVSYATYDTAQHAMRVDLDRDTVNRFPQFDDDQFERWTGDRWHQYDEGVSRATGVAPLVGAVDDAGPVDTDTWWHSHAWREYGRSDRPVAGVRDDAGLRVDPRRDAVTGVARDDDRRGPDYGERAQPGDVLGIESGGETTGIGDTAEDEDRRRERAERDMSKIREDERKHDRR